MSSAIRVDSVLRDSNHWSSPATSAATGIPSRKRRRLLVSAGILAPGSSVLMPIEAIQEMFNDTFACLPPMPAEKGFKWKRQSVDPMPPMRLGPPPS